MSVINICYSTGLVAGGYFPHYNYSIGYAILWMASLSCELVWLALLQLPNWVVVFKYWLVTVALVLVLVAIDSSILSVRCLHPMWSECSGGKITRIVPLVHVMLLTFFLVYLTSQNLKSYYYDACDIN
jgi:hypothetical protein